MVCRNGQAVITLFGGICWITMCNLDPELIFVGEEKVLALMMQLW